MGIGINKSQLENLLLDFFNLFFVSIYILIYRNPIFNISMRKVFWMLPLPNDDPKKWNRLDEQTKQKKLFSLNPIPLTDPKYDQLREDHGLNTDFHNKVSKMRVDLMKHNLQRFISLDSFLVNYIDLKYNEIWSIPFMKKIKNQLKQQNIYYNIVKSGSQVIYLLYHINTICLILLLSIMRQSLVSVIYIIVIIWKIMFNSEDALKQRS